MYLMGTIISSHWKIICLLQKYNLRTAKMLKYCIKVVSFLALHTNTNHLHSYFKQLVQGHVSSWFIKKAQQFSVTITQSQSPRHWLVLQRLLCLAKPISGKIYMHANNTHTTCTTDNYYVEMCGIDENSESGVLPSTFYESFTQIVKHQSFSQSSKSEKALRCCLWLVWAQKVQRIKGKIQYQLLN